MSAMVSTPPSDQTDRAILAALAAQGDPGPERDVVVVDDETGALTAQMLDPARAGSGRRVLSWHSSRRTARDAAGAFAADIAAGRLAVPGGPDGADLAAAAGELDAPLALMRLPKSLAGLEARARELAGSRSGRELMLVAGGRVKHMTRSQNDVLATAFEHVRGARGVGKSRALIASQPRGDGTTEGAAAPAARGVGVAVLGRPRMLQLRGIGGVFGSAAPDAGSLLLLEALDEELRACAGASDRRSGDARAGDASTGVPYEAAVDLGCGNGLLSAYLAAALPSARILASDDDADAVASTCATLAASGLDSDRIRITWDDALAEEPSGGADLVLLNPPFHDGAAIDATLVEVLLDAAARVLRPGGELWLVHNSHLRYRREVERRVGPVRQRARDRRFTVLSARRR